MAEDFRFNKKAWALMLCLIFGALFSCVPAKKLPAGKFLLYEQSIKGPSQIPAEEFESFLRQKTNRKILYLPITPYLSAYYIGEKWNRKSLAKDSVKLHLKMAEYRQGLANATSRLEAARSENTADTLLLKKEAGKWKEQFEKYEAKWELRAQGNWMMRSVGEPPSIYSPEATEETLGQMVKFLHYKGFFAGRASVALDTNGRRITATYSISEGSPLLVGPQLYDVPDTALLRLMQADSVHTLLPQGNRFDEGKFEQERSRLTKLFKDNGYFAFSKSYISFEIDTNRVQGVARIKTIVKSPPQGTHKQFFISEVVFDTDAAANRRRISADTIAYKGISYIEDRNHYTSKVLDRKVFIRPGAPYRQHDTEDTQRALADLNIFKFVNIKYDTLGGNFRARIFTSPYPQYQVSAEAGLNVSQALIPGPFLSGTFTNRNLLRSADIFEIQGRFSLEAQAGATNTDNRYRSMQLGINSSITLPHIFFPIPLQWNRILAARAPKTQFKIGYSFIDRPEYTRTNLQGAINYQWQNKKKANFSFSLIDVGIVNTASIDSAFYALLKQFQTQGNTLIKSFDRSLISSTTFSYTAVSGQYGSQTSGASYLRAYMENGGPSISALNKIFNGDNESFLGLRYYRFYKLAIDYRRSVPLGQGTQLASRLHVGVADAYGGQDVLPYEKYFFTGGSNSNRAWRARRVGPGSFTPERNPDGSFDYRFEQYGEVLIEANMELRGNLFGFVEGALFVDATNIWTTHEDLNRPGAKFEAKDFWKELAIGTGFGLRLDFSFMLIRLDVGVKMYDPARPEGNRLLLHQIKPLRPLGTKDQHIFNVGIGYPF